MKKFVKSTILTRVGIGDLIDLVRVKPDLSLTTLKDASSQALLTTQVHPVDISCLL